MDLLDDEGSQQPEACPNQQLPLGLYPLRRPQTHGNGSW